jgi:TonB family protein
MNTITKKLCLISAASGLLLIFSSVLSAQQIYYNYQYRLDVTGATEPPDLGGMPRIELPEKALKNGVEGTLKAEMTLATDGQVTDVRFIQTLPDGVEQAVIDAYRTFRFKPARRNGTPIDAKLYLDYTITAVYDERDKNVKKPKITAQPEAVYPERHRGDKRKDKVTVLILFKKDGTSEVMGVSSTMPKDFDQAARDAAEKIEFEPAVHKKSGKQVSIKMAVEYKFKP